MDLYAQYDGVLIAMGIGLGMGVLFLVFIFAVQMVLNMEKEEPEVKATCVSCGNPASSDFCEFCLNEE